MHGEKQYSYGAGGTTTERSVVDQPALTKDMVHPSAKQRATNATVPQSASLTQGLAFLQFSSKPPPTTVSNEQFCPQKIRSAREGSLDTLFGARNNIAKRR